MRNYRSTAARGLTLWSLATWSATIGAAVAAEGCIAAAAGAGAGAAGAAYFTSRGAKSVVNGSAEEVAARAQAVMAQMGIPMTNTKSEKGGELREFEGHKQDLDVTVVVQRHDDKSTEVEVTARRNLVSWDKDYAKSVLDAVVTRKG